MNSLDCKIRVYLFTPLFPADSVELNTNDTVLSESNGFVVVERLFITGDFLDTNSFDSNKTIVRILGTVAKMNSNYQ